MTKTRMNGKNKVEAIVNFLQAEMCIANARVQAMSLAKDQTMRAPEQAAESNYHD